MAVDFPKKQSYEIGDLLEIMRLLRGEGGCPWDREQDHHSIRKNFLEETYEVLEAIDMEDPELLKEELGDVLLQVAFHAQIEDEAGRFGFQDVCDGICKKLIVRHPHVFGELTVDGAGEVLSNWDRIKARTKGQTTATEALQSVPAVLPALMRSEKVQHRAARAGFDYPDVDWAMRSLAGEMDELSQAVAAGSREQIGEELGDLLFSAVNVARFTGTDPENALAKACEKFIARFEQVEALALSRGIEMDKSSIEELEGLWAEAKKLV